MTASNPLATTATSEQARRNHRLWLEHARAENRRQLDRLIATLHDDCEYEVLPQGQKWRGKAQVREFYQSLWSAIPDVKLDLIRRVDADDCVVEESEVYGTMEGPLFGIAPSGAPLRYRVVIFFPVREGLFTGERVYVDLVSLARQLPADQAQTLLAPAR